MSNVQIISSNVLMVGNQQIEVTYVPRTALLKIYNVFQEMPFATAHPKMKKSYTALMKLNDLGDSEAVSTEALRKLILGVMNEWYLTAGVKEKSLGAVKLENFGKSGVSRKGDDSKVQTTYEVDETENIVAVDANGSISLIPTTDSNNKIAITMTEQLRNINEQLQKLKAACKSDTESETCKKLANK